MRENETHYLIDWEPDEVTRQEFPRSWESKSNANAEAIADWERQKLKNRGVCPFLPTAPEILCLSYLSIKSLTL